MKRLFLFFSFVLIPFSVNAGEWIEVEGGHKKMSFTYQEMEAKLWKYLNTQSQHQFKPASTYTYQYQIDTEGVAYIFAFCRNLRDDSFDLTKHFNYVKDGGSCFFQIKYKNFFFNLLVNGNA